MCLFTRYIIATHDYLNVKWQQHEQDCTGPNGTYYAEAKKEKNFLNFHKFVDINFLIFFGIQDESLVQHSSNN